MNAKLLQKIEELTLHLINESKLNAEKQNALLQKLEKINHDNKRLKMENSEIKRRQAYIINKFKNFNKAQK